MICNEVAGFNELMSVRASESELHALSSEDIPSREDHEHVESSLDLERLMAGLPQKIRAAIQAVKLESA